MLVKEAQFKKFVTTTLQKLKRMFGFYMWTMNLYWFLDQTPVSKLDENSVTLASAEVDEYYLTFTIRIYRPLYDDWVKEGPNSVVRALVHEIVHVVVNPLYNLLEPTIPEALKHSSKGMLERIVEHISILFCNPEVDVVKLLEEPKATVEKKARKKPRARKSSKARP